MSSSRVLLTVGVCLVAALAVPPTSADPRPPAEPAKISIQVTPGPVSPGETTTAVVRLAPKRGIKINMYPQIRLEVSGQEGLVAQSKATVGATKPPPADADPEANYFKSVDPLQLELELSKEAPSGDHAVEGKLTYFYCVKASGFCAPKRMSIQIPVEVR